MFAVVACALLAAVALAACGGSGDSGSRSKSLSAGDERSAGDAASRPSSRSEGAGGRAGGAGGDAEGENRTPGGARESGGSDAGRGALTRIPGTPWSGRVPAKLRREAALAVQLVDDLLRMTNAGDPSVCTRLFTQHHVESVTGRKGAAAVAKCRRDIAAARGTRKLVKLEGLRIERLRRLLVARVQFVTSENGKKSRHRVRLVRARRGYQIYAALRAEQPR